MSEENIQVIINKLKYRKTVLQEHLRGLEDEGIRKQMELERVEELIKEMEPLQNYLFAREYLDSVSNSSVETIKGDE